VNLLKNICLSSKKIIIFKPSFNHQVRTDLHKAPVARNQNQKINFNLLKFFKMSNNSETGHVVNVANFNEMISFVVGYDRTYNPSNPLITPGALQEKADAAGGAVTSVNTSLAVYNAAISDRELSFKPVSQLVTRVMSFLKASGAPKPVYDQVLTVARKIKGTRASAIVTPPEPEEGAENPVVPRQVSASQMSFDSRTENFGKLVVLLTGIPEYNPNEQELTIEGLNGVYTALKAKNTAVINAEVPLSNARILRDEVLYAETTGLCDVALMVKDYVKALFGTTSAQYSQISKLRFTKKK
jgi:hypothetical protein